jgi:hypothetical protein
MHKVPSFYPTELPQTLDVPPWGETAIHSVLEVPPFYITDIHQAVDVPSLSGNGDTSGAKGTFVF